MKKTIAILLAALFTVFLSAACGSGSAPADGAYNYLSDKTSPGGMATAAAPPPMASAAPDMPEMETARAFSMSQTTPEEAQPTATGGGEGLAEKIIYTASAEIETLEFDETIRKVHDMLGLNGAFIESSYVSGRNHTQIHYGYQSYRNAMFSLRVPQARLAAMTESLENLGNVVYLQSDAQNITAQFYDTESRLTALRTQEESLIRMLRMAETVADMIIIEERLSEVRYGIESHISRLRNWQNQVDYSTLTLHIREVEIYTETEPVIRTYWQQIGDGLQDTTSGVGGFFMDLFKWLIVNLPVLIILAALAAAVVIIVKVKLRKMRKKRENTEETEQ